MVRKLNVVGDAQADLAGHGGDQRLSKYCAQNRHIVPLFGPNALAVSPRVGHIHVRVDDASWLWADASGNPIILMGLLPGPHKVLIELEDANHHALDKGTVTFVIPKKTAAEKDH